MYIEKMIKLKTNIYYIRVNTEYKKDKYGQYMLKMKDYKDDYYDGGNFSILIDKIEKSYTFEKTKKYFNDISFISDILYIYDRIPFLSGIKEVSLSKDNIPYSIGYISKEEIDKIIKENNVIMHNNKDFYLGNENTWFI